MSERDRYEKGRLESRAGRLACVAGLPLDWRKASTIGPCGAAKVPRQGQAGGVEPAAVHLVRAGGQQGRREREGEMRAFARDFAIAMLALCLWTALFLWADRLADLARWGMR